MTHKVNGALTLETVIPYLVRRGHLTAEELVANGVKVFDATRRNGNFRVERQSGHGLLLKQARELNALRTVAWEAQMYSAFQTFPASHPLRHYTVPLVDYDSKEGVLLLRGIPHGHSLAAHHIEGRFPFGPARWMGHALAALHSLVPASLPNGLIDVLPRRLPHALFLHRPDHTFYCDSSHGTLKAVQFMQSFPAFGALIDALTGEWRPNCLIHSDV